jgi:hypothetical protein
MVLFWNILRLKFIEVGNLYYVQLSVIQMLNHVLFVMLKSLDTVAFGNSLSLVIIYRYAFITARNVLDLVEHSLIQSLPFFLPLCFITIGQNYRPP